MSAILGHRPRGFILDIVSKVDTAAGNTVTEREVGYPGWKRVVQKLPSPADLRESLISLSAACLEVNKSSRT